MSWLDRQSSLGAESATRLNHALIGLVGLGGGNSHVAQQLAHLGIGRFVLVDDDEISLTNLNRLVGGQWWHVLRRMAKTTIIKRMILAINPTSQVTVCRSKWQLVGDALKGCDVVVGGLDSVRAKDEFDAFCRRFLIPYIDQGMDVHKLAPGPGRLVTGQVALSMSGGPCLRCLGIVTDNALDVEAPAYGAAGGRPQVVWPNGVLASSAVGLVVQLLTPWNLHGRGGACMVYDGNAGTLVQSERFRRWQGPCPHYPQSAVGDMTFDIRRHLKPKRQPKTGLLEWLQRMVRASNLLV